MVARGRYGKKIFPACTFRIHDPFTTVSIFQTGKIVITGSNRSDKALLAANIICQQLQKLGVYTESHNFRLENVVGSAALGYSLNLHMFYYDFKDRFEVKIHHRDVFPGLQIWPNPGADSEIVFILFASGAIVISGAKSEEQFYETYNKMKHVFPLYRLGNEYRQLTADEQNTVHTRNSKKRKK